LRYDSQGPLLTYKYQTKDPIIKVHHWLMRSNVQEVIIVGLPTGHFNPHLIAKYVAHHNKA